MLDGELQLKSASQTDKQMKDKNYKRSNGAPCQ